jgi:hypothetical protein
MLYAKGMDAGMDEPLPVAEAARVLGMSRDAFYKRIRRDSVGWEKGEDGRIYVHVDTATDAATDADVDAAMDTSTDQVALIASLEEQVSYLKEVIRSRDEESKRREEDYREESRRKAHLLAATLERIPTLEAPPDTQASPEPRESLPTASEKPSDTQAPPQEEKRPWWRRLFEG